MTESSKGSAFHKAIVMASLEKFATTLRTDFRFAPVNALLLVAIFVVGLCVHLTLPFSTPTVEVVRLYLGSALVLSVLLRLSQVWEGAIVMGTANGLVGYLVLRWECMPLIVTIVVALLTAPAIQIAYQWERAVVLRFGRFQCLRKSGLFATFPVIDKVAQFVDQRIRVADFSAETTLTADTVPVNVDAIAFWMVWDAEKAVLEVEQFGEAVVLSAQTALRNAIGRHDLAELLSERDRLGKEIQKTLDEKTSAWGITTQAVEIRDIIIPKGLEDAMSRQAQASAARKVESSSARRKRKSRRNSLVRPNITRENPVALHLRAMNMVYEGLRQKGSMIIVPSTAVETMGLGALGGLTAFAKQTPGGPVTEQQTPGGPEATAAEPTD